MDTLKQCDGCYYADPVMMAKTIREFMLARKSEDNYYFHIKLISGDVILTEMRLCTVFESVLRIGIYNEVSNDYEKDGSFYINNETAGQRYVFVPYSSIAYLTEPIS